MINTFRTLPKHVYIAFSGGIDSAVMLDIALKQKRDVTLLWFHHADDSMAQQEFNFARYTANKFDLELQVHHGSPVPKGQSKENHWATERNTWFKMYNGLVCTGHHLNDVAEWYLMTAIADAKGGFLTNYQNDNVIRPLIITPKSRIVEYASENNLEYIHDLTNDDLTFNKRNRIRAELLPQVLSFNPGFLNTIRKRILEKEQYARH